MSQDTTYQSSQPSTTGAVVDTVKSYLGLGNNSTTSSGQYDASTGSTGQYDAASGSTGQYGTSTGSTGQYGTSTGPTGQYDDSTGSTGQYGSSTGLTGSTGQHGTSTGLTGSTGQYGTSTGLTGSTGQYDDSTGSTGQYGSSTGLTGSTGQYGTSTGLTGSTGQYDDSTGSTGQYGSSTGLTGSTGQYDTVGQRKSTQVDQGVTDTVQDGDTLAQEMKDATGTQDPAQKRAINETEAAKAQDPTHKPPQGAGESNTGVSGGRSGNLENRSAIPTAGGERLGEKHWGESKKIPDNPAPEGAGISSSEGQPTEQVKSNTAANIGSAAAGGPNDQSNDGKETVADKVKDKLHIGKH